jgi:acyl-CoA synthetase (NDP forming)
VDALFEQAGVIRADTLTELAAVAALLSSQPVPSGDRVAILTNAGGPGIMCADACQAQDVDVPELPAEVSAKLLSFLPEGASARNPIDMIATASADHYRRALVTLIEEDICDAILTIFVPPLVTEARDVATAIRQVAEEHRKVPIAAVFMTVEGPPAELASERVRVPGYEFPEVAAEALALSAKYGRWRARPPEEPVRLKDADPDRAAAIISAALGAGTQWLSPGPVAELLDAYGLPLVHTQVVPGVEEAVAAAAAFEQPVALKAVARDLIHKSDVGGVRLGLANSSEVRRAAESIVSSVRSAGLEPQGFVVQPMAPAGVELIIGVVHDPSFGPVLACGAGGTAAELIKDMAVRITPVYRRSAAEMLRSLRTFPLLNGYRGAEPCDVGAVEDVLVRVSALVEAHPAISELDCNPVIVAPNGALIVDARVRVEAAAPRAPLTALRPV